MKIVRGLQKALAREKRSESMESNGGIAPLALFPSESPPTKNNNNKKCQQNACRI